MFPISHLNKILASLLLLCLISISSSIKAGPWFTGPLLAPSGHTIPKGHANFEIYSFNTDVQGVFDTNGHVSHFDDNRSYTINGIASQGLTDRIDVQAVLAYSFNHNLNASDHEFGDTTVGMGVQVLQQLDSKWRPDLRLTIQEIIPTGHYDNLNPAKKGTDSTGLGSYQTAINLNFQNLQQISEMHYLRTRLSLGFVKASNVHIHGFSAYGGNEHTDGLANPGDVVSIDIAQEYTLTQHWVAVMEANASKRNASSFVGDTGFDEINDFDTIGHLVGKQISLAPALEYNFTPNIGLIGGVWFPVYGRSTSKFMSYVIALNAFW